MNAKEIVFNYFKMHFIFQNSILKFIYQDIK